MSIKELRDAFHEAATDAVEGATGEDGTEDSEAADSVDATSAASAGEEQSDDSTEAPKASEGQDATEATDVPTEYFGYEFPPDMSPEQRAGIISELKKRDDTIGKLLRERQAPEGEEDGDVETQPSAQDLTDEDILRELGLDPNDPFDEVAGKVAVPLVRKQLEQQGMLSQLIELQELNEIDRSWRSSLEGLEREFGAFPAELDHERVMEFAAENGLHNPVDAYWRIMGPGRGAVDASLKALAAERDKARTAEKEASATTRPATSQADGDAPIKAQTTKEATREVATRLLKDLGL